MSNEIKEKQSLEDKIDRLLNYYYEQEDTIDAKMVRWLYITIKYYLLVCFIMIYLFIETGQINEEAINKLIDMGFFVLDILGYIITVIFGFWIILAIFRSSIPRIKNKKMENKK